MIVVIVLLTLGFTPPVAAQPWQICGDTVMNYTTSTRRHANLEFLSTKLTDKATTSPDHFSTDFAGVAPDTVYGLALCRGDVNSTACRACIAAACVGAQQLCPHRVLPNLPPPLLRQELPPHRRLLPDRRRRMWSTTDTTNAEPQLPGWDPGNAESVAAIIEIVLELLLEMARQAAYNSGARMFATG